MGQFIPLAQEFEDSIIIIGATMCIGALAFDGKQRMGMFGTGAFLVVATLIVILVTFKSSIPG